MCSSRFWKNLYPTGIKNNSFNILARRSDGVDFIIPIYSESVIGTINLTIFRNALIEIESHRICECTSELSCQKHKIRSRK